MAYAMNWWIEISTHSLTRRLTAYIDVYYRQKIISTHSLTRRLTIRPPFLCSVWKHFNSQPHKEADEVTF